MGRRIEDQMTANCHMGAAEESATCEGACGGRRHGDIGNSPHLHRRQEGAMNSEAYLECNQQLTSQVPRSRAPRALEFESGSRQR